MTIEPVAENAVLIRFGDTLDEALMPRILQVRDEVEDRLGDWITDLVPAYTTLLCLYDVRQVDFRRMCRALQTIVDDCEFRKLDAEQTGRLIELPVYYATEVGPDLEEVARRAGLSLEQTIRCHSERTYRVFAMGFSPGFAFMGSVDAAIATPRKDTPRDRVAAGSVGIANQQTAVYPAVSPGGWNLIGRCPETLFSMESLAVLRAGDRVHFKPIDRETFLNAGGAL